MGLFMQRKCLIHCPGEDGGYVWAVVTIAAAMALAVVVWQVLAAVAVVIAVVAGSAVVLAVPAVLVTRRLARTVCIPSWSAAHPRNQRRSAVLGYPRAIERPRLAIEAARAPVIGVVLPDNDRTVMKEEAR